MNNWVQELNKFGKQRKPVAFFINFEGTYGSIVPLDKLVEDNIHIDFPSFQTPLNILSKKEIQLKSTPISFKTYREAFEKVQFYLHRGDSYLTNLTFSTIVKMDSDLYNLFDQVNAKYRIVYKDEWVCFSPETFVQIEGSTIRTYPMKGTIVASHPDAAIRLKTDKKEVAEHHTVVDLLRNDLSQVAKKVHVKRLMYIDKIKTINESILQMSSEIEGQLNKNWREELGSILKELLPAGSISGAPKNKTLEIIHKVEQHQRGFYTGIAGVYDGNTVDSCILIRFIQKTHNGFVYKSGGGLTALSQLEAEYDELNQKIYVPIH